ncbi:MAG: GNAT family protein [Planctomycetota bacterium]|nr:GNAT family protein [Planctomycetota bacterium]MDA1027415.1 GNAT family protein [Planctomycetota bacterium]
MSSVSPVITLRIGHDLRLEPLGPEHAEEIFQLMDGDRTRLGARLPWVPLTKTVSDTTRFIEGSIGRRDVGSGGDGSGDWAIVVTIEGIRRIVGVVGLHGTLLAHRRTAIGYWVASEFEGCGYVTRSVEAVTAHCFAVGLHRVEIHCATDNRRSRSIPERLGFRLEGERRQVEWIHGQPVDHAIYARLATD